MTKSVLVTGIIRSGTTWVGQVLDTALDTIYFHEPFNPHSNWNACFPTPAHYLYLTDDTGKIYLYQWKRLLDLEPFRWGTWRKTIEEKNEEYIERQVGQATDRDNIVPIVKDPMALYSVEWLVKYFDMSPVFVLRHPIGIVKSIVNLEWWGVANQSPIFNQPLLRERFFPHISDDERNQYRLGTDSIERVCWMIRLHYETIRFFRREYPEWIYLSYEDMTLNPGARILDLMATLELSPSEATLNLFEQKDVPPDLDGLSPEKDLTPVPSKVDQILASTAEVTQWQEKFDKHFGHLAEDFEDIWPQTVAYTDEDGD